MNIPTGIFALLEGLPGEELVLPDMRDLEAGRRFTPEALLLFVARARLIRAGLAFLDAIDPPPGAAELLLYQALLQRKPESAYGEYNSFKRRLDSFIRCLEIRVSSTRDE